MRKFLIIIFFILFAFSVSERRIIALRVFSLIEPQSKLLDTKNDKQIRWYDDYFTIHNIDSQTFAIGEPRYQQKNYSYLILGEKRAILFDSGTGQRNIKPVVESLTKLPITVIASHLHFDHVGSHNKFNDITFIDLPKIRERVKSGIFELSSKEHLGFFEGIKTPEFKISKWIKPNASIDLGDRKLYVLHTPGHSRESVSLFDQERMQLFSGDFIYPGELLAILPGSSFSDYLDTVRMLEKKVSPEVKILSAHGVKTKSTPILVYQDLIELKDALEGIKNDKIKGHGFYIKLFKINSRIQIVFECLSKTYCL